MAEVEIEVKSDKPEGKCPHCGMDMGEEPMKPQKTKDQLIAELKTLLANTSSTGVAERWVQIDEKIAEINDLKEKD